MEARVTKLARVSARFSKSFARRRFRPNQAKVRSTTQRRGRTTKPFTAQRNTALGQALSQQNGKGYQLRGANRGIMDGTRELSTGPPIKEILAGPPITIRAIFPLDLAGTEKSDQP